MLQIQSPYSAWFLVAPNKKRVCHKNNIDLLMLTWTATTDVENSDHIIIIIAQHNYVFISITDTHGSVFNLQRVCFLRSVSAACMKRCRWRDDMKRTNYCTLCSHVSLRVSTLTVFSVLSDSSDCRSRGGCNRQFQGRSRLRRAFSGKYHQTRHFHPHHLDHSAPC